MKCKIMLMTHGKLAESLSVTAELICGEKVAFKNMPEVLDMQEYKKFINDVLDENKKTGVLFLTDLMGGSPFLACMQVMKERKDEMELVTGCNLGMLLEVISNMNNMDIHELKEIAVKAGQQGVIDIKKQMKGLD